MNLSNRILREEYDEHGHRVRRQATGELYMDLRQTRCPLLLVADYRFFSEMGGGSSKTTVNYLISLIDRVHKIYEETVWKDSSGGQVGTQCTNESSLYLAISYIY